LGRGSWKRAGREEWWGVRGGTEGEWQGKDVGFKSEPNLVSLKIGYAREVNGHRSSPVRVNLYPT